MNEPMLNDRSRWLVRGGSLLLMLGFVMPSVLVSCGGVGETVSLYDLTTLDDVPLLYLVPVGALAMLILAFLPSAERWVFWGQVAGAAASLAGVLIPLASLGGELSNMGIQMTPQLGMLVPVAGYVLVGVGLAMQAQGGQGSATYSTPDASREAYLPPPVYTPPPPPPPSRVQRGTGLEVTAPPPDSDDPYRRAISAPSQEYEHLRLVRGDLPVNIVPLTHDNFTIGRDSGSDLHLPEKEVSRQHARLRFGQGAWFIQDMESAGGIMINGKSVKAQRLEDGDQVSIGPYIFRFCKPRASSPLDS